MDKKTTGERGENLAALYLEARHYTIIEKNYRYKKAEVDLIVQKDNCLVFVEVKARSRNHYGFPEEAVDAKKATLIIEAADHYIHQINWPHNIRFDVIAVEMTSSVNIKHFKDAFY